MDALRRRFCLVTLLRAALASRENCDAGKAPYGLNSRLFTARSRFSRGLFRFLWSRRGGRRIFIVV